MKYAFLTDDLKTLNGIKKTDILYFGSEFCVNLMPDIKTLKSALQFCSVLNAEFVLVLPFLTDDKIEQAEKLLKFLSGKARFFEVVFNDWGAFALISKYKNLKPVLGRLLTKQRKDPAAFDIIENKQPKMKIADMPGGKVIIEPKKTPASLKKYFRRTFLNSPDAARFMLRKGVKRCEFDVLPWGTETACDKKIKTSLYYPFANITVTRYCGAVNLKYSKICSKICRRRIFEVGAGKLKYPYFIKGNAVFYRVPELMFEETVRTGNIDRIVINDAGVLNKILKV